MSGNLSNNERSNQSPAEIANWVATNANIASLTQYSSDIFKELFISNTKINLSSRIAGIAFLNKPIFDLAIRGVMVEKGLIDIDEVDMGWIISEAIKSEQNWFNKDLFNLGKLFLYAPIATATGYLVSENNSEIDKINIDNVPEITEIVIDNTTPEDTVNLVTMMYEFKSHFPIDIVSDNLSITEQIEDLLEDEINLYDLFNHFKEYYIVFDEIVNKYSISFTQGFASFVEAITQDQPFDKAITHTFISLLSEYIDSHIYNNYGRIAAQELRNKAIGIIEKGSIFTDEGNSEIKNLINNNEMEFKLYEAKSIGDITENVTFLASMSGLRP